MKKLITILALMILFTACRKQQNIIDTNNVSLSRVKQQLAEQVSPGMAGLINYEKAIVTSLHHDSVQILRLPLKNYPIAEKFILLKINGFSTIEKGSIVTIHKTPQPSTNNVTEKGSKEDLGTAGIFNGHLLVQQLDETLLLSAPIQNGYIVAKSNHLLSRIQDLSIHIIPEDEAPRYVTLPVVLITAYNQIKGLSYSDWYNLEMMLAPYAFQNYAGNSGYYSSAGGNYGGGSSSSGSTSPGSAYTDAPMIVDFEGDNRLQINLEHYLKCFEQIPDGGATFSIELLTDLPVDDQPLAGYNTRTGSPGHTFLQIRKQNSDQSIVQNIGFYPESALKILLTTAPVPGIFADDRRHEFNAAIKMNLNAEQFNRTIAYMNELSKRIRYDIDDYNCTDFALEIFNFNRTGNAIEIPKIEIPGTTTNNPYGSNTPQGLYLKLAEMKTGSTEANNISIPSEKGYVANSTGACN